MSRYVLREGWTIVCPPPLLTRTMYFLTPDACRQAEVEMGCLSVWELGRSLNFLFFSLQNTFVLLLLPARPKEKMDGL